MSDFGANLAVQVWNITERTIKHFIKVGQSVDIPDEKLEQCLIQMIVKAFRELREEKDGEKSDREDPESPTGVRA